MFARFGRLTLSVLLTQRMSAMRVAAATWQHHFDGPVLADPNCAFELITYDAALQF
jgi:hypothetical protein